MHWLYGRAQVPEEELPAQAQLFGNRRTNDFIHCVPFFKDSPLQQLPIKPVPFLALRDTRSIGPNVVCAAYPNHPSRQTMFFHSNTNSVRGPRLTLTIQSLSQHSSPATGQQSNGVVHHSSHNNSD